jgi:hypothetical protein
MVATLDFVENLLVLLEMAESLKRAGTGRRESHRLGSQAGHFFRGRDDLERHFSLFKPSNLFN